MNKEEIQNMLAVNRSINDMEQNFRKKIEDLQQRIDKAIEILKLCNSQCAKETIEILKGTNQ